MGMPGSWSSCQAVVTTPVTEGSGSRGCKPNADQCHQHHHHQQPLRHQHQAQSANSHAVAVALAYPAYKSATVSSIVHWARMRGIVMTQLSLRIASSPACAGRCLSITLLFIIFEALGWFLFLCSTFRWVPWTRHNRVHWLYVLSSLHCTGLWLRKLGHPRLHQRGRAAQMWTKIFLLQLFSPNYVIFVFFVLKYLFSTSICSHEREWCNDDQFKYRSKFLPERIFSPLLFSALNALPMLSNLLGELFSLFSNNHQQLSWPTHISPKNILDFYINFLGSNTVMVQIQKWPIILEDLLEYLC